MKVNLDELIRAFSATMDLVGVDEVQHGKRVAYMAAECGATLGYPVPERCFLYRLGLLHDCGVSSSRVHKKLVNEMEWEGAELHCEIGAARMKQSRCFEKLSEPIRYHHTRWEILQDLALDSNIKILANLIFLTDRVDALLASHPGPNNLCAREEIFRRVKEASGLYFQKDLVEAFLETAETDAFWMNMIPRHLDSISQGYRVCLEEVFLDSQGLAAIANLFAQVVDAKSGYTAEHSCGVSRLSAYMADLCGLPGATRREVEVAGLLHDLGKLQIPDMILEFDGGLSFEDMAIMRHHSYVTYRILSGVRGFEELACWAADHHEKLDGSGYPFRKVGKELCLESRIIMVADIFQALAQDRPYRRAMSLEDIVDILKTTAAKGQLDREIVKMVEKWGPKCHRLATGLEYVAPIKKKR